MAPTLPRLPVFEAIAQHKPDSTVAVHSLSGRRFQYGELLGDVRKVRDQMFEAAGKSDLNGERVAFMVENSYDYIVTLLAILAARAIAVPLSPAFPIPELQYIVDHSEALLLLSSTKFDAKAKDLLAAELVSKPTYLEVAKHLGAAVHEKVELDEEPDAGKAGMMLYTSGTTNRPKGVLLPESVMTAQARSLQKAWEYAASDHLLHVLPLHHIHGTINALYTPLFSGSSIEFLFPFNADFVWRRLAAPFSPQANETKSTTGNGVNGVNGVHSVNGTNETNGTPEEKTNGEVNAAAETNDHKEEETAASTPATPATNGESRKNGEANGTNGTNGVNGVHSAKAADKREVVTFFTVVPTVYSRLLATHKLLSPEMQTATREAISPAHLRLNISGSAALPTPIKQAWTQLSRGNVLLERFGMTEVGMALSCGLAVAHRVDGSVGWPLPSVEARLVDVDTGKVIPAGEEVDAEGRERAGEIQLRGPTIFAEYWRNPEATASEFVDAEEGDANRKAWFKTGDVAVRRTVEGAERDTSSAIEKNGTDESSSSVAARASQDWTGHGPMYFILGRRSADIIKSGGEKVSALEVERELLSLPVVSEAAVVAVPSGKWGQKVGAVIVLDKDSGVAKWSVMDMRRALKGRLVNYKIPQVLRVVEHIPRNAMGKINKKQLVAAVFVDDFSGDEAPALKAKAAKEAAKEAVKEAVKQTASEPLTGDERPAKRQKA